MQLLPAKVRKRNETSKEFLIEIEKKGEILMIME